jgi:hypothetical protein
MGCRRHDKGGDPITTAIQSYESEARSQPALASICIGNRRVEGASASRRREYQVEQWEPSYKDPPLGDLARSIHASFTL